MNQVMLAQRAQLTPSFLSRVESDQRTPSIKVSQRIADALEIPFEVILWEAVELPKNVTEREQRICGIAKAIVKQFMQHNEGGTSHDY